MRPWRAFCSLFYDVVEAKGVTNSPRELLASGALGCRTLRGFRLNSTWC